MNTTTDKYVARYADGIAELKINKVQQSDAGVYSCKASNDLGFTETSAKLLVNAPGTKQFEEVRKQRKLAGFADDGSISKCNPYVSFYYTTLFTLQSEFSSQTARYIDQDGKTNDIYGY